MQRGEFLGRVRRTVNRLFQGSSVLDVFHEETHGFWREALQSGRITREETIASLRALDTVLDGKTTKVWETNEAGERVQHEKQLRFLPEGEVTDTALDEAISKLAETEILRTRQGGKDNAASEGFRGASSGLISRNLTTLAKLAPGAAEKLSNFINTVRSYWGVSLARAQALKRGIREGTIDFEAHQAFLDKVFGDDRGASGSNLKPEVTEPAPLTNAQKRARVKKLNNAMAEATELAKDKVGNYPDLDQIRKVGTFWRDIQDRVKFLRFPRDLTGTTVEELMHQIGKPHTEGITFDTDPYLYQDNLLAWEIRNERRAGDEILPKGEVRLLDGDKVYVDSQHINTPGAEMDPSLRRRGGAGPLLYQLGLSLAKNLGIKFIPDPRSVTDAAESRRVAHYGSSAIRYRDTSHIHPFDAAGNPEIPGFTHGRDVPQDIGRIFMQQMEYVRKFYPEIDHLRITPDLGKIVDDHGTPVSDKALDHLLKDGRDPSHSGIGNATLRRAIATRTLLESGSGLHGQTGDSPSLQHPLHEGGAMPTGTGGERSGSRSGEGPVGSPLFRRGH